MAFRHWLAGAAVAVSSLLATSGPSSAAMIVTLADVSDGVLDGMVAGLPNVQATPAGFINSFLYTGSDIPSPQNAANIQSTLMDTGAFGSLSLVGQNDNYSGGFFTPGGTGANVFAVHLGQAEFVFVYDILVTAFNITVPDGNVQQGTGFGGLSNIRAYTDASLLTDQPPPDVPLPAAAWLLISGVGGLGAVGRWRRKAAV